LCHYIWAVPIIVRIKALIDSVGFLGQLASPFSHPFPFAIYSQSLRTAVECGYWDVDIIPEVGLALFTASFCSQNTVKLTTPSMVHVTNRTPPGSECNPAPRIGTTF
jgi:hypothetical protein